MTDDFSLINDSILPNEEKAVRLTNGTDDCAFTPIRWWTIWHAEMLGNPNLFPFESGYVFFPLAGLFSIIYLIMKIRQTEAEYDLIRLSKLNERVNRYRQNGVSRKNLSQQSLNEIASAFFVGIPAKLEPQVSTPSKFDPEEKQPFIATQSRDANSIVRVDNGTIIVDVQHLDIESGPASTMVDKNGAESCCRRIAQTTDTPSLNLLWTLWNDYSMYYWIVWFSESFLENQLLSIPSGGVLLGALSLQIVAYVLLVIISALWRWQKQSKDLANEPKSLESEEKASSTIMATLTASCAADATNIKAIKAAYGADKECARIYRNLIIQRTAIHEYYVGLYATINAKGDYGQKSKTLSSVADGQKYDALPASLHKIRATFIAIPTSYIHMARISGVMNGFIGMEFIMWPTGDLLLWILKFAGMGAEGLAMAGLVFAVFAFTLAVFYAAYSALRDSAVMKERLGRDNCLAKNLPQNSENDRSLACSPLTRGQQWALNTRFPELANYDPLNIDQFDRHCRTLSRNHNDWHTINNWQNTSRTVDVLRIGLGKLGTGILLVRFLMLDGSAGAYMLGFVQYGFTANATSVASNIVFSLSLTTVFWIALAVGVTWAAYKMYEYRQLHNLDRQERVITHSANLWYEMEQRHKLANAILENQERENADLPTSSEAANRSFGAPL